MSQKEKREDAKQFGIKATTVKSVKFTARIWGSISNMASVKEFATLVNTVVIPDELFVTAFPC